MAARPRAALEHQVTDADFDEGGEAIDVEFQDSTRLAKDLQDEESDITSEFGAAAQDTPMHFQVRRLIPGTRKNEYLFEGTRSDLPVVPRIQREYGKGSYQVWIFKNGKLYRKIDFNVGEPKYAPPVVATENPALDKLVQLLAERQNSNPFGSMDLAGLITAGAALVTAFKGLMPPPPPPVPQNSMKDTLDLLLVAREFSGGSDREPGWTDIIAKFATPEVLGALASMRGTQQGLPAPTQPLALPGPQSQTQPTPDQIREAQIAQLRAQLDFLVTRAQHNSDPALYADMIEDTLPPEFVTQLKQPGAYELLVAINPKVATYAAWFQAVLQTLATPAIEENDDQLSHDDLGGGQDDVRGSNVPQRGPASFTHPQHSSGFGGNAGNVEGDGSEGEGGEN